jgi:hypothetical protein
MAGLAVRCGDGGIVAWEHDVIMPARDANRLVIEGEPEDFLVLLRVLEADRANGPTGRDDMDEDFLSDLRTEVASLAEPE